MQVRAPLLLERIFEDFFADSPLQQQEAQKWKQQRQQHRQQLGNRTSQLNQTTSSKDIAANNRSSLDYQRMEGIEVHKAAEKARRQAKWDAVRMLGVLYALDKTHIGPSSSTNALVLSGACDPPEPVPHIPASALTITTVALNDTADPVNAELETAIQDSSSLSSASDSSSTLMTIATTVTGLDEAATPPSLSLTNSPSASATVSGNRLWPIDM
ncbi:hypothetical protein FBU30_004624 [Linnemannia zychae]|nr:hypothetical protein FBU30_004624 [Linnemannia zychae]